MRLVVQSNVARSSSLSSTHVECEVGSLAGQPAPKQGQPGQAMKPITLVGPAGTSGTAIRTTTVDNPTSASGFETPAPQDSAAVGQPTDGHNGSSRAKRPILLRHRA